MFIVDDSSFMVFLQTEGKAKSAFSEIIKLTVKDSPLMIRPAQ